MSTRGARWLAIACAWLGAGCACDEANLVGTVFAHDDGTATLSGTVTVKGAPEERGIEVLIAPEGTGARYGVIPDNLLDAPTTCGDSFHYEIRNLDAGAYKILGKVEVSGGEESNFEGWYSMGGDPVVTVGSATAVMLGDGETLTGIDFELVNVLN